MNAEYKYCGHVNTLAGLALSYFSRFLYAKLLLLLAELRTLKVENTRQILHIHHFTSMTPLLSEIIS